LKNSLIILVKLHILTLKKIQMNKIFAFLFLAVVTLSLNRQLIAAQSIYESTIAKEIKQADSIFYFRVIPSINNTWCYDIYKDKKLFIHQTSVPGFPGNEGFKTKSDAEKVAQLVIEKLKKGEMPPSVTKEELTKLKVL
jgi:hypothetical protein